MTDEQLICWAAGFFDGEGCVNISCSHRKLVRKSGREVERRFYGIHAIVCQREEAPLKILHALFGGHLFPYEIKGNTYYRWHVWSDGALNFFRVISEFSVLKRERMALAMDLQEFKNKQNAAFRFGGYPDWVNNRIESFYLQMKDLNKKKVNPDNPNPKQGGAKRGGKNYFRQNNTELKDKGDLPPVN